MTTTKKKPERSRPHLAHVRAMPCAWCSAPPPSDPDHASGKHGIGTKPSDYVCIPLCRWCHRERHATGRLGNMTSEMTKEWSKTVALSICAERLADVDGAS